MTAEPFPFIFVRSDALDDKELLKSPATFMTLCVISTYANRKKDGTCYFKQNTIAERIGKSRQAISKDLKKLSDLGYIQIIPQMFEGRQSNNLYRILYDSPLTATVQPHVAAVQPHVAHAVQPHVAPKPVSYKPLKEKKELSRSDFMKEVDRGVRSGEFEQDFPHLSDTEIALQASPAWDWLEANEKRALEGSACTRMRIWIRRGIKDGVIAKKPSKEEKSVSKESQYQEPENPIQPWQEVLKSKMPEAVFRTWIRPLWHDHNGNLCAPTQFIADRVRDQYRYEIRNELKFSKIIVKAYQPERELEHA